jgi:asparagine synthase (glutamine-hydrolysing)
MCAIAGIMDNLDNRNSALERMLCSMVSRGPDSKGDYFSDDIALGHRRLKVIDLSSQANQPMSNENRSLWLVYNGEIYNFKELRSELIELGHSFKSQSDAEVVLHSFEEWGRDCLSRLRGMFAFAIWDKDRKQLFLARDRLGIKPLYYYCKDGIFIFASQVRAILSTEISSRRLNHLGVFAYLDSGGLKDPLTIVEGVYSLPAASYMVYDTSGLQVRTYWDPHRLEEKHSFSGTEEITERIKSILKESIRMHLISDVPLGIFLSGGIDSTSLLSLAKEASSNIRTVSLVYKEKEYSEDKFSRMAAERYLTQHREIVLDAESLLKDLPHAIMSMDEPTFNGVNTYFISKAAKESGITVALSGLGGDEVFCGYVNFRRIDKVNSLCRILNNCPPWPRRALSGILKNVFPHEQKDKAAEIMEGNFSLEDVYFWMRRLFTDGQKKRLLKMNISQESERITKTGDSDFINQLSYLELTNYMRDILLRDTDFMSMAHSLEVRVPFLDHKLIEFILSVPGKFKIDKNMNKPLLVRSLANPLPEAIVRRRKKGFVLPFASWMKEGLRKEVEQTLQGDSILDEIISKEAVSGIWQDFLKGRLFWQRPWAIYVLKRWVNIYLE